MFKKYTCLNNMKEPMKEQILHYYYCQIKTHEVCDVI